MKGVFSEMLGMALLQYYSPPQYDIFLARAFLEYHGSDAIIYNPDGQLIGGIDFKSSKQSKPLVPKSPLYRFPISTIFFHPAAFSFYTLAQQIRAGSTQDPINFMRGQLNHHLPALYELKSVGTHALETAEQHDNELGNYLRETGAAMMQDYQDRQDTTLVTYSNPK